MRVVLKLAPHPPACRRAAQSQKAQEPGRQHLVPVVNDEEVALEGGQRGPYHYQPTARDEILDHEPGQAGQPQSMRGRMLDRLRVAEFACRAQAVQVRDERLLDRLTAGGRGRQPPQGRLLSTVRPVAAGHDMAPPPSLDPARNSRPPLRCRTNRRPLSLMSRRLPTRSNSWTSSIASSSLRAALVADCDKATCLSPFVRTAAMDAFFKEGLRPGIAAVFCGHLMVSRSDDLLVDCMAGQTVVGSEQRLYVEPLSRRRLRSARCPREPEFCRQIGFLRAAIGDGHGVGFDHMAAIAPRVPGRVRRLHFAGTVGGPYHQDSLAACGEAYRQAPLAERITPEVGAEFRRPPGLAAIDRNIHGLDARAAVESDTLELDRTAGGQHAAAGDAGDKTAHRQGRDRPGPGRRGAGCHAQAVIVWHAIGRRHEQGIVAFERLVEHLDFGQVLDPVSAEIAGNDQLQRIAVQVRDVLAVHAPGQEYVVAKRVFDVQRFPEIGGRRQHRLVQAVEHHLSCIGADAGLFQHCLERHPDPARIAHGAVCQLGTEDARRREPAAVAGALVDSHDFDRLSQRLEFGKRQAQAALYRTLDLEPVGLRIDRHRQVRQMVAHEERVIGRDRPVVEDLERCFEVRRTGRDADQGTLLRITDQFARAIGKRDPVVLGDG
nr:hypothetical protein [Tanacetum cinerariifolium]